MPDGRSAGRIGMLHSWCKATRLVFIAVLMGCSQLPASWAPSTPAATASLPSLIRSTDSWIEVDLARQVVILHEADKVIGEYAASSGLTTDPNTATPPGLYRVQMMEKGPIENVPGVFVSDILIFHVGRGLGIHSMPMDAGGKVLDATLGQPGTAGCVRVGESSRVFEFAEMGMRIWIH